MSLANGIIYTLIIATLIGCNPKSDSSSSSGLSQEALTSTLSASEKDGVLTIVNSKNELITSRSNYNSYKISQHIVAIQFTDQGERVIAYNSNGKMIFRPTSPNINSYKVTDNIFAAQFTESGERVIAYNSQGEMIFQPSSPNVSRYFVKNDFVGVQESYQGERLDVIKYNKKSLLLGELILTYAIVKDSLVIETFDGEKVLPLTQ